VTSLFILLAGMAFQSGVTVPGTGSHTALTWVVALVLVACVALFNAMLAREVYRSLRYARRVGAAAGRGNSQPKLWAKTTGTGTGTGTGTTGGSHAGPVDGPGSLSGTTGLERPLESRPETSTGAGIGESRAMTNALPSGARTVDSRGAGSMGDGRKSGFPRGRSGASGPSTRWVTNPIRQGRSFVTGSVLGTSSVVVQGLAQASPGRCSLTGQPVTVSAQGPQPELGPEGEALVCMEPQASESDSRDCISLTGEADAPAAVPRPADRTSQAEGKCHRQHKILRDVVEHVAQSVSHSECCCS
jgi:hypothetical protein